MDVDGILGWFPYGYDDSHVNRVPAYKCGNRGETDRQAEVRVTSWTGFEEDQTLHDFAEAKLQCYPVKDSNLHGVPDIAAQLDPIAGVGEVEYTMQTWEDPSAGEHGGIAEQHNIVVIDVTNCGLDGRIAAEEVENSGIRINTHALQNKCHSEGVEDQKGYANSLCSSIFKV